MWRSFQSFLTKYEYFILPTTQLPPFDVNTPWPTEINGVRLTNYIDWMKSCWYISARQEGLRLAHAFEQATNFGKRHPNIAL